MQNDLALTEKVDLTNCDREPIHIPGSIQPHGTLLVLAEPSMEILQIGANAAAIFGAPAESLAGSSWEAALDAESRAAVARVLPKNLDSKPYYLPPLRTVSGAVFEAVVHRFGGLLILELEENSATGDSESRLDLYAALKTTLAELQETVSVDALCRRAAELVREFTGFDRVMIYRFADEGSGEVVAESKRDDLEPYLGLNYPASDIPQQARALYLKSWLRFKVDNDAAPVAVVPPLNPQTGAPLDMSFAALRSMSPIHTEYLRNMGVKSTMSISIVAGERLWGLVACHHYAAPRYVPHEARMACEFLAHSLSLQMASKEETENRDYIDHLNRGHAELVEAMLGSDDFIGSLVADEDKFLGWIETGGAAIALEDDVRLFGKTPREENVRRIVEWLDANQKEAVFATDRLPDVCADGEEDCRRSAAGVLSIRLSRHLPHFIIWLRPEIAQRVNWAGNPQKPVEKTEFGDRLTPRKSFELWVEEVSGKSAPWKSCEREAAAALRHSITEIIVRRAKDLADLNVELERSNFELDAFVYAASHDLKEPLRGIHNFSYMLIETYQNELPAEGQEKLRTLMRLTERMENLIESLLYYSRIGRSEIRSTRLDTNRLVGETIEMVQARLSAARAEITVAENLPAIEGDAVLLREVFTNLMSNAVKYNEQEIPRIEIGFTESDRPAFFVRDNGIGIPEKYRGTIFHIFKRLHGRDAYGGGIGAGLTITRKIVERHGGEIWVESAPEQGTTFYFTIGKSDQDAEE